MIKIDKKLNPRKTKSHPFWKWFWLTFLIVSLAYAWYSFYVPSNHIKWDNNITSVLKVTNNFDKNTVLFFTGEWCVPCRIMKGEVFADEEVHRVINSKFTPVMIDIDNPKTKELVNHYRIGATPTTIIVDSKGEVLDFAVGKIEKNKFLEMLNNVENPNK